MGENQGEVRPKGGEGAMKILKSDILRLCLSLFIIAAVVSLMLGGVNALTKDRIAQLEGEAELETIRQFYDYDAVFEKAALEDGTEYFIAYKPAAAETPEADGTETDGTEGGEGDASAEDSGGELVDAPDTHLVSGDSEHGAALGYAVTVSENGYGGEIKMLVCFNTLGEVNGMGVISMSETSGVGTRITGEGFFDQFTGKTGPFKFVKNASASKNEIVAISGASISSKAAVSAVNKAYALLSELFTGE